MSKCPNEYVCEHCGGTFHESEDWSEEKAEQEFRTNFGEAATTEETARVCDACYKLLLPLMKALPPV